MIYKIEEYIKEDPDDQKFPVKRIQVLDPVDGSDKQFIGQVAMGIQTPYGVQQIPINFEIEAKTIQEAFAKFVESANPRIEEMRKELEEELRKARQQASSRIVRPGEVGFQPQENVIDFKKLKTD
jgi:hypothetical protein